MADRVPWRTAMVGASLMMTSCTSLPAPPHDLAINFSGRMSKFGYVAAIGFFTEGEMKSARWEFARMRSATMNWCRPDGRFVRRDIRWFDSTISTGQRCAMVIYTVQCPKPKRFSEKFAPPFSNSLEQDRFILANKPEMRPSEPSCGEKDRRLRNARPRD